MRRLIRYRREPGAGILRRTESVMTKSKDRNNFPLSDQPQPHKALLIELKGERAAKDGTAPTASTEMFAALSLEEVIAYV